MNLPPSRRADLVAAWLRGSWRMAPEPLSNAPADLEQVAPFLLASGAGPLAWLRLAATAREPGPACLQLRHALQSCAARNLCHEHRLLQAHALLQHAGIECLLLKGRALAPLYANPDARPFGDIDLCVAPAQLSAAVKLLEPLFELTPGIDLQGGVHDLPDRSWDQICARSQRLTVGMTSVRVLGPEDQLRHLCLHQARHGCWRPLWLCDVAAALERVPPSFTWSLCLDGERYAADWVRCVLRLAVELLGAQQPPGLDLPPAPQWVVARVVSGWGRGLIGDSHTRDDASIAAALRAPQRLGRALRARWPNPIEARFLARVAPGAHWPHVFLQTLASFRRFASFFLHKR